MTDSINIFLLNIRSIKYKVPEIQLYLNDLEKKHNLTLHVLAFTETWAKRDDINAIQIDGYSLTLQDRVQGRGGGVALYVKNGISYTTSELISSTHNAITFKIHSSCSSVLSGMLVYRPPKTNRDQFFNELTYNLSNMSENTILLGDFNIDLLKHADSYVYTNLLSSMGFTSLINQPTREVAQQSSCIDHVHLRSSTGSSRIIKKDCLVLPTGLSDHHTVLVKLGGMMRSNEPVKNKYTIRFVDWSRLNLMLNQVDWKSWLAGNSVNEVFSRFYDKLNSLLSECTKIHKKSPRAAKRNPWASDLLVRLARQKNDLYLLVKKFPANEYLKIQYKKVSKKVQQQTTLDKTNYYGKMLDESGVSSRRYWRIIGSLTGHEKRGIDKIKINSTVLNATDNQLVIANEFNKFFVNVTKNLASKFSHSKNAPISNLHRHNRISKSFFAFPITPSDIINAISSTSNKNSVGTDGIGSQLLRTCMYSLLAPLEILFNLSLTEGIFPDALKNSIIVPIFKTDDPTELSNYRPISILSTISKIFEYIIKNRVVEFLNQNKYFSDRQFGFLPGRNTDGAVTSHITDIVNSTERNNITVVLYLDITKAFDTVDHDILLNILHEAGFRGQILSWFSTYLKSRRQVVRIGDTLSSPLEIASGVPQGSTLGPILFLVYVNQLLNLKISGRIFSFADDTAILFTAKTKSELFNKVNSDLRLLTSWFWEHKLYPNLSKTKLISFGFNKIDLSNTFKLHSNPLCTQICNCPYLAQVNHIKYLGLILDEKLNWEQHSIYLQGKLRRLNFMLYHMRRLLTNKHLLRVYKVLYEPVLRYGVIHWGHAPKKNTYPIKVLHKYAIRIIAGIKKQQSTVSYFQEFGLNFEQIVKYFSAKYGQKNMSFIAQVAAPSVGLRERGPLLYRPKWLKDVSRAQTAYSVPTIYNSLPLKLREIQFHGHFARELRKYIVNP